MIACPLQIHVTAVALVQQHISVKDYYSIHQFRQPLSDVIERQQHGDTLARKFHAVVVLLPRKRIVPTIRTYIQGVFSSVPNFIPVLAAGGRIISTDRGKIIMTGR